MARLNKVATDDELPPLEVILQSSSKGRKAESSETTTLGRGLPRTKPPKPPSEFASESQMLLKRDPTKGVATKKQRRLGVAQRNTALTMRAEITTGRPTRTTKRVGFGTMSDRRRECVDTSRPETDKPATDGHISSSSELDDSLEDIEFWSGSHARPTWIRGPEQDLQRHESPRNLRASRTRLADITKSFNTAQPDLRDAFESEAESEYYDLSGDTSSFFDDGNSFIVKSPMMKKTHRGTENDESRCQTRPQLPARHRTPSPAPQSPTKSRLKSPSKAHRIPPTPHRPSMDAFWDQEHMNDWNDTHSPRKLLRSPPKNTTVTQLIPLFNSEEGGHASRPLHLDVDSQRLDPSSPRKSRQKSDPQKRVARCAFDASKHQLAEQWLTELDEQICGGRIRVMAEPTGGVKVFWSKKLNSTAGRAHWKRETTKRRTPDGEEETVEKHTASIELAEKVIDDADRLRNVIAHEFCHLATFMISGVRNNPHGKEFKSWASKCSNIFRDQNIVVTTKHSYEIDYKYIWECVQCGHEFKRHSKSIDPNRQSCGVCKARLVQIKPVPRTNSSPGKVSEYQLFMKENFQRLKTEHPTLSHAAIMEKMGALYRERKKTTASALVVKSDVEALTRQLDVVVLDD